MRDDPAAQTAGRYYFSPPNAPFYPSWHNLGSRSWKDANVGYLQALGEDLAQKQSYDPGAGPAVNVRLVSVGTERCITQGETFTETIPSADLVNGFPPSCIAPEEPVSQTWAEASDFQSCSNQLAGAKIIEWSYDANTVAIYDFLRPFLGPAYTVLWHPPTILLPGVTTAVSTDGALCWVDGTANYQQLALQAAYSLVGPASVGPFSTSRFWFNASEWVITKLRNAGFDPSKPVYFCGHSYGGCAALLALARMQHADANRELRYLTYGTPHLGDGRLNAILRISSGLNLRNDSDLVTALPPNLEFLTPVVAALHVPVLLVWPSWIKAPNGLMMDVDGNTTHDDEPILDFPTLFAFAVDALAALPYPTIAAHNVTEYFKRIHTRCSAPEWPLTVEDYVKLFADNFILMESGDPVWDEHSEPILLEY